MLLEERINVPTGHDDGSEISENLAQAGSHLPASFVVVLEQDDVLIVTEQPRPGRLPLRGAGEPNGRKTAHLGNYRVELALAQADTASPSLQRLRVVEPVLISRGGQVLRVRLVQRTPPDGENAVIGEVRDAEASLVGLMTLRRAFDDA